MSPQSKLKSSKKLSRNSVEHSPAFKSHWNEPCAALAIAEPTVQRCLRALQGVDLAEIRIDQLNRVPTSKEIHALFSTNSRTIATCRAERFDTQTRKQLLLEAIDAGASFIDVEIESAPSYRRALMSAAEKRKCEIIVSFHDFERTPSKVELDRIVRRAFAMGADIAKIACTAHCPRDGARLLGLLDSERRLVVIGMGPGGFATRVCGPLLGSEFTFAARYASRQTAPGQPDRKTLIGLWNQLRQD